MTAILEKLNSKPSGEYDHYSQTAANTNKNTRAHQNIGQPFWDGINHERRRRSAKSLKYHLETYHAKTFYLPWAEFHLEFIKTAERVIFEGGWFAFAVARGFGKSKLSEGIVEWAALHGYKRWPVLIGASSKLGEQRLKNVLLQLRLNDKLGQDFPEVCHPFKSLGRSARMAEGQHIEGNLTAIAQNASEIIFPCVQKPDGWDYKDTNGTRISAFGLTGGFRGMSATTEDLETIRPDLAVPDDPQTRDSAKSVHQTLNRKKILTGEVAYLNGPEEPMSVLVPCTVIEPNDLAHQILTRDLHPEYRGQIHSMLKEMPKNLETWDTYNEIYRECLRLDIGTDRATDYYRDNREKMDEGAEASWPERFDKKSGEISAVQHAMNRRLMDEDAFWAEGQNMPRRKDTSEVIFCPAMDIIQKVSHAEQFVVPHYATQLAAHLDVQQRVLYRAIVAASPQFEASVIDYGTCPEQKRTFFRYRESLHTIQDAFPGEALDTQLYKAIQGEIARIATTKFVREDGLEMSIGLIMVDVGWKDTVVVKAIRESPYKNLVLPAKGIAVRAKDEPLAFRKKRDGETKGHEWLIRPKPKMPSVQQMLYNSNAWKTAVHTGFLTGPGPGCLTLFKARPERHRMFAEHCNAEVPKRVKAKSRSGENEVDEWEELPAKPDNHLFDNAANCFAALSKLGCVLPNAHELEHEEPKRRPKRIGKHSLPRKTR